MNPKKGVLDGDPQVVYSTLDSPWKVCEHKQKGRKPATQEMSCEFKTSFSAMMNIIMCTVQ